MEHKSFRFCKKRTVAKTGAEYYSCVKFRAGCTARLIIKKGGAVVEKNQHSCDQAVVMDAADVRKDMSMALQTRAVKELATPPAILWQIVYADFQTRYPTSTLNGIPRQQGVTIIKNVRQGATGGDVFRAIESAPARCVSESDRRPFLQFSMMHPTSAGLHRMLGFAHPDLVRLLRYPNLTLFIDGTFFSGTKRFLTVPDCDDLRPKLRRATPLFYVLVDAKKQDTYWRVLEQLVIASDRSLEPLDVTCDFELALINAVIEQFPLANIVGCLFHWKQALRRKIVDLGIPREQIADAMKPRKLDVLTVIPAEEVRQKGLRYVRSIIDETGAKKKWNSFYTYFVRTWIKRYDMSLWNVSTMLRNNTSLVNRTNNPLEKYKRDFAARIGAPHPGLLKFVEAAKAEANAYVKLLDDIKHGRQTPPVHA